MQIPSDIVPKHQITAILDYQFIDKDTTVRQEKVLVALLLFNEMHQTMRWHLAI